MINLTVFIRRALGVATLVVGLPVTTQAYAAAQLLSRDDLKAVSEATRLASAGKLDAATQVRNHIRDPLGRKLAEWVILRSDGDNEFARYAILSRAIRRGPA